MEPGDAEQESRNQPGAPGENVLANEEEINPQPDGEAADDAADPCSKDYIPFRTILRRPPNATSRTPS